MLTSASNSVSSDVKQDITDIKNILTNAPNPIGSNVEQSISDIKSILTSAPNSHGPCINISDSSSINTQEEEEIKVVARPTYLEAFYSKPGSFNMQRKNSFQGQQRYGKGLRPTNNLSQNNTHRPRQHEKILGSREKETSDDFFGAPRTMDIYVGGCDLSSTKEKLITYCKKKVTLTTIQCEELVTRSDRYKSSKVSIDLNDKSKLMSSEFWPSGIIVRKFYKPRNSDNKFD